jgi:hypothetical protein
MLYLYFNNFAHSFPAPHKFHGRSVHVNHDSQTLLVTLFFPSSPSFHASLLLEIFHPHSAFIPSSVRTTIISIATTLGLLSRHSLSPLCNLNQLTPASSTRNILPLCRRPRFQTRLLFDNTYQGLCLWHWIWKVLLSALRGVTSPVPPLQRSVPLF